MISIELIIATLLVHSAPPIILTPESPIEGLVTDRAGLPVVGADVFLVGGAYAKSAAWQGRSDEAGRFRADPSRVFVADSPATASRVLILVAFKSGMRVAANVTTLRASRESDSIVRLVLRPADRVPVRVVDPEGRPVLRARVQAFGPYNRFLPAHLNRRITAITDSDGRAILNDISPDSPGRCVVWETRYGRQIVSCNPCTGDGWLLSLRAVGHLIGRVVDQQGRGIREAVVFGFVGDNIRFANERPNDLRIPAGDTAATFEATTDTDGRFEVPSLASGRFLASCMPPSAAYVQPPSRMGTIQAGTGTEVRFVVARGAPVRGQVLERNSGRPITGVFVHLQSLPQGGFCVVRTDNAGRYQAWLGPGRMAFAIVDAGPYRTPAGASADLGLVAPGSSVTELRPIELVRGIDVDGIVLNESRSPLGAARVEAREFDGMRVRMVSVLQSRSVPERSGEFTLDATTPGVSLDLCAFAGDSASGPPAPIAVDGVQRVTLIVSPQNTVSLSGRVVDEYGKPVTGARIEIYARRRIPLDQGPLSVYSLRGRIGVLETDAEGRFLTPRQLLRYEEFQAVVMAPAMEGIRTEWYAPTTPSFFDIVLKRRPPPRQADIWREREMGLELESRGRFAEAEANFEPLLVRAKNQGIQDPVVLALLLTDLAKVRRARGKTDESKILALRALGLREKAFGPKHPYVADSLSLLGRMSKDERRFVEAHEYYRKALAIREQLEGGNHPHYATDEAELGGLEIKLERYEVAERLLTHAIRAIEAALGRESPALVVPLGYRAIALMLSERLPDGESDLRRAIPIAEKEYRAGHTSSANLIKLLDSLALLLRESGREAEAKALRARARSLPAWVPEEVAEPEAIMDL